MSQNQKQELISKKEDRADIYVSTNGDIYITSFNKEVLQVMSTLNATDKNLKIMSERENISPFCG